MKGRIKPAKVHDWMEQKRLPEFNKRFDQKQLPPVSKSVFKRISQIYGIPFHELLPVHLERKPEIRTLRGAFLTKEYSIHFDKGLSLDKRLLEHELLHAAQRIMGVLPEKETETLGQKAERKSGFLAARKRRFRELSAEAPLSSTLTASKRAAALNFGHLIAELPKKSHRTAINLLGYAFGIFKILPVAFAKSNYRRHGADGLILLYAHPPKYYMASAINLWERKMVKQGFLEKNGGLTKKGMQLLRRLRPRGRILWELEKAKEARLQHAKHDKSIYTTNI